MKDKNIYNIANEIDYKNGQIIFNEGSSGDWIYVIMSGSVEISKNVGGKKYVITTLQPDELFGELAFIGGINRTATARAVGETTLGIIDRGVLDKEYNKLSGEFRSIFQIVILRFRQMLDRACDFTRRAEPRVPKGLSLVFKERQTFKKAYTSNVSAGGLFIKTENPFRPGEKFPVKLQLSDIKNPVEVKCEVIWARIRESNQPDRVPGMGVKFCEISEGDSQLLKEYIAAP